MDVHLRDLRYFTVVAEHLHFTRAAEDLHVSQPALSKQVRTLEQQLGTPLFARDRRTVRLTPAGEALLPHARALLEAWGSARQALDAAAAETEATLVVGMSTGVGRGLLPAVRARLAASAPGLRLQLRQVHWDDPTAGLGDPTSDVDAAFVWLPLPDPDRYEWTVVATEPRLVALPSGHRLAGREEVALADLDDEPFLALPRAAGALRDFWLATAERGGREPRIGAEVSSAEETAEAVVAGLGVVLLATGNGPLLKREGITLRPVTGVGPSELALAWRRDDARPVLAPLRAAVRAAAR
jgi:DNA-binding transcriptional LysR family regulator